MSQLQTLAQAICLDTHSSIRLEAEGETTRRITSESRGAFRTILPDEA